jgi:hypothetical protein
VIGKLSKPPEGERFECRAAGLQMKPRLAKRRIDRTITEIRLRDTQPSDFRVPLPATPEAIANGCTCPAQPEWPTIAIASDCPLHG